MRENDFFDSSSSKQQPGAASGEQTREAYKEALTEACSEVLKTVMEAMADPEGGIGIDQVYALIDGCIGQFMTASHRELTDEEVAFALHGETSAVYWLPESGIIALTDRLNALLQNKKPGEHRADSKRTSALRCHADSDGDCSWKDCPQEANNRANYQTVCPLWRDDDEDAESAPTAGKFDARAFLQNFYTERGEQTFLDGRNAEIQLSLIEKAYAAGRAASGAQSYGHTICRSCGHEHAGPKFCGAYGDSGSRGCPCTKPQSTQDEILILRMERDDAEAEVRALKQKRPSWSDAQLLLLRSIAKEMRHEHDVGDGHFSTKEVLFIEALAATPAMTQLSAERLQEVRSIQEHMERYLNRDATTMEMFLFVEERINELE